MSSGYKTIEPKKIMFKTDVALLDNNNERIFNCDEWINGWKIGESYPIYNSWSAGIKGGYYIELKESIYINAIKYNCKSDKCSMKCRRLAFFFKN